MNKKGFATVAVIVGVLVIAAVVVDVWYYHFYRPQPKTVAPSGYPAYPYTGIPQRNDYSFVQGELQAHDANRISDMSTIKASLSLYLADVVKTNLGCTDTKTIYASAPITVPAGWKAGANMGSRKTDGTGWIPVNFGAISSGAPIGALPVDPVNTDGKHLVYIYVCNAAANTYELDAVMESQKFGYGGSGDVVSQDGGNDPYVFEQGNDLTLIPPNLLN